MRKQLDTHPIFRFTAPTSIQAGSALKHLLDTEYLELLGQSLQRVYPKFNRSQFLKAATIGLDTLELVPRSKQIALEARAQLPDDIASLTKVMIESLGPELIQTERNGLTPFFYLPHSQIIAAYCLDSLENGLHACYELTKRFTAEFCIRPYLIKYTDQCLATLQSWTRDTNPHVRRLCSEGTRTRLPWGIRLPPIQQQPRLTRSILEDLKDDPELYVRRSVANHLGDLLKDDPEYVYELCDRWLKEVERKSIDPTKAKNRKWILRHAVRLPAKKGDARALELRTRAK